MWVDEEPPLYFNPRLNADQNTAVNHLKNLLQKSASQYINKLKDQRMIQGMIDSARQIILPFKLKGAIDDFDVYHYPISLVNGKPGDFEIEIVVKIHGEIISITHTCLC